MKKIVLILSLLGMVETYAQNLDHVDQRIQLLPKKEYLSIGALYKEVVLPTYSEAEKVRAISMWTIYNISYDVTYTHSKTPLETLTRRKGVCQSYAEFFKALCDTANIECHLIVGHGRNHESLIGMPVRSDHAWNAVKIDNKHYLFDLTWASGYVNGDEFTQKFNKRYYMAAPEDFIWDHFPDDPKWQLLEKPVLEDEFKIKPYVEEGFFLLRINNLYPCEGIIRSDTIRIKFNTEQEIGDAMVFRFRFNEYQSVTGKELPIRKKGKEYELIYVEDDPGAYKYSIYLNGISAFNYKVATPNYKPNSPKEWDLQNPHSLIGVYHYIFCSIDQELFNKLNPGSELQDLKSIPLAGELKKSLSGWYGDYERFYMQGPGEIVTFYLEGFSIILQKSDAGWVFQEIKRRV